MSKYINKKTAEELKELIDTTRAALGDAASGVSDPDMLVNMIDTQLEKYRKEVAKDTPDAETVLKAVADAHKYVTAYNTYYILEQLNVYKTSEWSFTFNDYLHQQTTNGLKIEETDGGYERKEAKLPISFYDVLAVGAGADFEGVLNAARILADNIARNITQDDTAYITRPRMAKTYRDLRERLGWTKTSNNQLAAQLNELVNNFITPKGTDEIKMINADVKYLKVALLDAKNSINAAGGYKLKNDETILNFVFRAIYTRRNSLAYEFQRCSTSEKKSRGSAKNAEQTTVKAPEEESAK